MISVDTVLPQDDLTFSCLRQDELISRWFCSKNPRSAVTLSSERLVPPSLTAFSASSFATQSRVWFDNLTDLCHQPPHTAGAVSLSVSPFCSGVAGDPILMF